MLQCMRNVGTDAASQQGVLYECWNFPGWTKVNSVGNTGICWVRCSAAPGQPGVRLLSATPTTAAPSDGWRVVCFREPHVTRAGGDGGGRLICLPGMCWVGGENRKQTLFFCRREPFRFYCYHNVKQFRKLFI